MAGGRSGSIFLIDDDECVLVLLAKVLARKGFPDVQTYTDPARAIEMAFRLRPDLIFVDHCMPGLNCELTVAQLRQRLPGVPLVIMSSFLTPSIRASCAPHATDFIEKPFLTNCAELDRVLALIQRKRASQASSRDAASRLGAEPKRRYPKVLPG